MASLEAIFRRVLELCCRSEDLAENKQLPSLRKLNDSVYEFYSPTDGTSLNLEIVFFHGLEPGDCEMAYVETWTSFLHSTASCWPQTLLSKDFPRARILSVSYDSSIKRDLRQGNMDLYLTAENLLYDLIDGAKVAANPGLPVIMVGKDTGGLVIKAICMEAKAQNRFAFISNLKGIFYYRTPHLGIENLPTAFTGALAERLAFNNTETARLGSNFSKYRKSKWATRAILSLQKSEKVPELVISEASQRYDVDECYTANEGIDTVCKCQAKTSSTFNFLTNFISRIERGKVQVTSSSDGGRTKDVVLKYSLDFENDGSYVPMKTSVAEVKNALQKTRIVVLHGCPGSGKTSLGRYLALQYEAEAQQGTGVAATCSTEQSYWLPTGVVYMTCGNGAEIISMQRELLRKFDIEVPLQDNLIKLEGTVELQKLYRHKLVDHLSKLQFCVLVVLDDVWDGHLLENLLVPGDRVRYLLIAQISTLWNAHDSKRVQIQDVTLEDARHILGNNAKFEGGMISKDLENVADEIIAESGSHPLAMATLGIVLQNMERTVKDWQELKDNLKEHLKTEEHRPSSFGQKYRLSVDASMMFVLDLLDKDAKQLLYKITLFNGPFIPETFLQLFLRFTLPLDINMNISKPKSSLVAKGVVQIETNTIAGYFGGDIEIDMRVIRIHSLRQYFILTTRTKEIDQIIDFLDNDYDHKFLHLGERSDLDFAIALCALYGVEYVKKRALKKMGPHFMWSAKYCHGLALVLKPFVSLMLSKGDKGSHISQAAAEVFWSLLIDGSFNDHNIEILLYKPECTAITCDLISALCFLNQWHLSTNGGEPHVALSVATMPSTMSKLVMLLSKDMGVLCKLAAKAITSLFTPENRLVIAQFPSCLERLVELLAQDVEKDIQEHATRCLAFLTHCQERVDMLATPFLLERLVSLLSQDMGLICELAVGALAGLAMAPQNRVAIVQFPSCLKRLISLLAEDVDQGIKEEVASCFVRLLDCDVGVDIMATPFLLERLVLLLSKDMGLLCQLAARAIASLSRPENKLVIVQFPSCLERLVELLAQDVEKDIQKHATRCLAFLTHCPERVDMLATPFLLERLVSLLSQDMGLTCELAVGALAGLAMDPQNRVAIVQFPSCLKRLISLLAEDVDKGIKEEVASCFVRLLDCDVGVDIMATPFLLERLVLLLSKDMGVLCQLAARAIASLSRPENKLVIVQFPSCLERLVELLAQDVEKDIQKHATRCLAFLTHCPERVDMLATPFLLERLVSLLSQDMGLTCELAVGALAGLAMDPQNRVAIVQFPSCLKRLISLLAEDVDQGIKEDVLHLMSLLNSDVQARGT